AYLQSENKKGIIVDLDNTLVPWDMAHATEEVIEWLKKMKEAGIQVTIFSNNNADREYIYAEPFKAPFVSRANKPIRRASGKAQKMINLNKEEIIVVGDRLLTDVRGGNRAGFYTILGVPSVESDAPITKFNRRLERK